MLFGAFLLSACGEKEAPKALSEDSQPRIASLHGTATEVLFALGFGDAIVLRDVTSTYPPEAEDIQNAGHVSGVSAESILAASPGFVFAAQGQLNASVQQQLSGSGIRVIEVPEPVNIASGLALLELIAKAMDASAERKAALEEQYACVFPNSEASHPSVLFVYGRGSGNFLVGGGDTPVNDIITAAGGRNVASEISGFKPLSTEALLAYDPEVILMFDHSFHGVGGADGLLQVPGMSKTRAGVNNRFVHFPGQQINGFGPRTCEAINELYHQLLN